jgi:peptidyl-prolyl cis-trans isomerase SurA
MDTRRGILRATQPGRPVDRRLNQFAWAIVLGFAGCSSAPTLSSPVMPTTARAQKPDEPPATKPTIELTAYSPTTAPFRQTAARICATVNGVAILDDELREATYPQMLYLMTIREPERSRMRKEVLSKALEQIIEREVVLQEANERLKEQPLALKKLKEFATKEYEKEMRQLRTRTGIKSDDDFRLMLASQGISLAGVQRQKERNIMAREFMLNLVLPKLDSVGREDLENYYKQHPEEFRIQDSITWQDIFIDVSKFPSRDAARQFAESLSSRARNGEAFPRLVKEFDQGDSSWRNGEGFGRRRGEIRPSEAEPILFEMKAGDISPVIELGTGFHVAKLTTRDYAGPKPFNEKTQQEIRDKLKGEIYELEYKKAIDDLKRKTTIEISASASQ